jgi:hypothetical protein
MHWIVKVMSFLGQTLSLSQERRRKKQQEKGTGEKKGIADQNN